MLSRIGLAFAVSFTLTVACGGDDGAANDSGDPEACYADAQAAKPAVSGDVQKTWGAPCETDADCVALIGDGAICDDLAVIFELPGGYCTKPCIVGDDPNANMDSVEFDDPDCDPNGGVHCLGANGIYSRCGVPCTGDEQCGREGYFCRRMPEISDMDDPTFCLMDDCCEGDCSSAP